MYHVFHMNVLEVRIKWEYVVMLLPNLTGPVSYTHLDVYKRQMVYSVGEIAENPPAQEVLLPVWNICAGIRPCILELIFLPVSPQINSLLCG